MSRKAADKPKESLRQDRFGLLATIAKELGSDVVFPISFDLSQRISRAMRDDAASMQQIAQEILKDPLVVTKLLQLANSVAYNTARNPVTDVNVALNRLGLEAARSVCLACALAQMGQSNEVGPFSDDFKKLLVHSLKTAGIARFLAKKLAPRVNAESALLAGLVHDMGAFFLFYRIVKFPELVERPVTARYLVAQWHESIGAMLLDALKIPQEIIDAVSEVDFPRPTVKSPKTLADIVYLANLFAGGFAETQLLDIPGLVEPQELSLPEYSELKEGMNAAALEMLQIG